MKKFYLLSLIFTCFFVEKLSAQNSLAIEWQNSFGGPSTERGQKILTTAGGDIVILGELTSESGDVQGSGLGNIMLARFSRNGIKKWGRIYTHGSFSGAGGFSQTADGGFIITGYVTGGCRTGPGGSMGSDIWVIKVDSVGDVQWEKCYGSPVSDGGYGIIQKGDGSYILISQVAAAGFDVSDFKGGYTDIWLSKLDGVGNLLWGKCIGGSLWEQPLDIKATNDGGFIFTGYTASSDKDFSNNGSGNEAAFIIKYNSNETIEWNKCYGGKWSQKFNKIIIARDGSYLAAGVIEYGVDPLGFDVSEDAWIVKINNDGNLLWEKRIGGSDDEVIYSIIETADSSLAICGWGRSVDGDFIANTQQHRFWVAKIERGSGKIKHQAWIGGRDYEDIAYDIVEANDGGLVVVGTTLSNNPYVQNYKGGGSDILLLKLRPAINTFKANIYIDNNLNGIKDAGEPAFDEGYIKVKKNASDSVLFSYKDGYLTRNVDTGRYEISFLPHRTFYTVSPSSKQFHFTTYNNIDSVSFGVIPVPGIVDLSVNAWSVGRARLGRQTDLSVRYINTGTASTNGILKIIKDHRTEFVSSPQPFKLNGDTLTLNITDLQPNDPRETFITLSIKTPPALNFGDTLLHQVSISHNGIDYFPADDQQLSRQTIMAAFDPNDKREITSSGKIYAKQVQNNEYLAYQIRFQNVGNDTAFNIVVRDTINEKLNINTLEMISADHAYSMQVSQDKYVEWQFNNILLPDSNVNEPLSHGYLIYRIKPKSSLAIGDIIKNSASIYFDYNLPVMTNVEKTIIVPDMPSMPLVSGINIAYCSNQGLQKGKINNLPLTGSGIAVTVHLDNDILSIAADSTFSFNPNTLATGQHIIKVIYSNVSGYQTDTHNFSVAASVTPKIDLTANVNHITNLATPIVIIAAQTGGGVGPLYAFAKDRTFAQVLQPESANNILSINPATLTIGDNWIYARVKTSATCYTAQIDTDSILMRRDAATNIIDADNPAQVITVSPNPFDGKISIHGLNSGKIYRVVLYNVRGQAMYTIEVKNKRTLDIPATGIVHGIYWLSIYDAKKKLIGTERVVKY